MEISVNDLPYCELLNTELQVLHNEVKSLYEIINILNSELKSTRITEVLTTYSESAATLVSPLPLCGNCVQLDITLRKASEEINSQKFIISLLNKENKTINHPQQVNLVMDDGSHNVKVSAHPHQPKETRAFQDTLAGERYTFPPSNRYAVLSTVQDQIHRNVTPNPDQNSTSCIFSLPSKKHKLQPKVVK